MSTCLLCAFVLLTSSDAILHTLYPGDDGYAEAIAVTNAFCHVRCPRFVLQPTDPFELAEWMRSSDAPFTVKGGGHSYGCQSVAEDDGVLIETSRLKARTLHTMEDGSVQLELGAGWTFADVLPWLEERGYIMPHGECSTVGVAGWLLNGGNHPELWNFNRWYGGRPFLKRITAVTTQGSVIEIDDKGDIEIIVRSPSESSDFLWKMRRMLLKNKPAYSLLYDVVAPDSIFTHKAQTIGANWIVATSFRIEVLPRPEPFFAFVSFDLRDVLAPPVLDRLLTIDHDVSYVDCGIIVQTNALKTQAATLTLKCADWVDSDGATLRAMFDRSGFEHAEMHPVSSSYLAWHTNSSGKGWVPMTRLSFGQPNAEQLGRLLSRLYTRRCEECFVEINHWEPFPNGLFRDMTEKWTGSAHMDWFCSDTPSNKERCVAWSEEVNADPDWGVGRFADPHLPNCDPSEVTTHYNSLYFGLGLGRRLLKRLWDPNRRISYWMDTEGTSQMCDAGVAQGELSSTCRRAGVDATSLAAIKYNEYKERCDAVDRPWLEAVRSC